MFKAQATSCHVGGPGRYIPAHINQAGKAIAAQLTVSIYPKGSRKGSLAAGEKEETFDLTIWGNHANAMAWLLSPGKQICFLEADMNIFRKTQFEDRMPVISAKTGLPYKHKAFGFKLLTIDLGEDSPKLAADEIAQGLRRPDWNDRAAGSVAWRQIVSGRCKSPYMGGPKHGYAAVLWPAGVQQDLVFARNAQPNRTNVPIGTIVAPPPPPQGVGYQPMAVPQSVGYQPMVTPQSGGYQPVTAPQSGGYQPMVAPTTQGIPTYAPATPTVPAPVVGPFASAPPLAGGMSPMYPGTAARPW